MLVWNAGKAMPDHTTPSKSFSLSIQWTTSSSSINLLFTASFLVWNRLPCLVHVSPSPLKPQDARVELAVHSSLISLPPPQPTPHDSSLWVYILHPSHHPLSSLLWALITHSLYSQGRPDFDKCMVKGDLEPLSFLPLSFKCWGYRLVPPHMAKTPSFILCLIAVMMVSRYHCLLCSEFLKAIAMLFFPSADNGSLPEVLFQND